MDSTETEYQMPAILSDGTYANPFNSWGGLPAGGSLWTFMKDRWAAREQTKIPDESVLAETLPVHKPDLAKLNEPPRDKIQYVWIGHASVLYQMNGWNVLSDPIWSERCSPVFFLGPKRYRPPPLEIKELPNIDAVVISHNHYDHLDKHSVQCLNERFGKSLAWFVPLGLKSWFTSMSCENVTELNWWQSEKLTKAGCGPLEIVCTPAQHWSLRNGCDRNKSLWSSWVLLSEQRKVFFSGDTGYCEAFQAIGKRYGPFDLSAIAIGAYCPRYFMANQHIDPEQALKIHCDLTSKNSIGIHWGTFPMGSIEPYLEPRELVEQLRDGVGASSFITVDHGSINHID